MLLHKLKSGFTLIEIIMVIAVIGVITAVVITGYSRSSASYRLNITADTLVEEIQEVRQNALRSGNLCYGLSTKQSEISILTADYLNPVQLCDVASRAVVKTLDFNLEVISLTYLDEDLKDFDFYFVPPSADFFDPSNAIINQNEEIRIEVGTSGTEATKLISVTPATGIIKIVNPVHDAN